MATRHSCVLASLNNPMLNGLALGLQWQEGEAVSLQTKLFPCCAGQGLCWNETAQGYSRCTIRSRVQRVQALAELYRSRWPQHARTFLQVSPQWSANTLLELATILKQNSPYAAVCYSTSRQHPSPLWSKAVALNWRFGIEARVLHLQSANNASLAAFTADSDGPLALCVEQVDKLWDPLYAETLEFIIQRAYNAEASLWMDVVYTPKSTEDETQDRSLKASFSRKIAKLRSQHPLDSLSLDGQSRLRSMLKGPWTLPTGDARNA